MDANITLRVISWNDQESNWGNIAEYSASVLPRIGEHIIRDIATGTEAYRVVGIMHNIDGTSFIEVFVQPAGTHADLQEQWKPAPAGSV